MDHVLGLLLEHIVPADIGNVVQTACIVVLLEPLAREDWVSVGQRDKLELWRLHKPLDLDEYSRANQPTLGKS